MAETKKTKLKTKKNTNKKSKKKESGKVSFFFKTIKLYPSYAFISFLIFPIGFINFVRLRNQHKTLSIVCLLFSLLSLTLCLYFLYIMGFFIGDNVL